MPMTSRFSHCCCALALALAAVAAPAAPAVGDEQESVREAVKAGRYKPLASILTQVEQA